MTPKVQNGIDQVEPFPRERQLMVDGGRLGLKKHTVHALLELDITNARETLRQHRVRTGEALSYTAFFLACLGQAIDMDRHMHAYRGPRNRLIMFADVDVNMLFEVEIDGEKAIRPHILRGVNHKSVGELHDEIRQFQSGHATSTESRFIAWFVRLPGVVRRLLLRLLFKSPRLIRDYYGTVLVTSLCMFGSGSGWGIPVPNHSLQITLGGIAEKPWVVRHQVLVRQVQSVTISFDHDVIDGAPAARFAQRLKRLVERGYTADASVAAN